MSERYTYRPDGWPLCPQCGEDELMSMAPVPSPADVLRCLNCNWTGDVPLRDVQADLERPFPSVGEIQFPIPGKS